MEGARPRQGLGAGPVTGALERPSQGAPENRKATNRSVIETARSERDALRSLRQTLVSIHAAERQLQAAGQLAERRQAVQAVDAALHSQQASRIAAVIARFAGRRAGVAELADPAARAAAMQQLGSEEANELARLALEHAAEKRQARRAVLASVSGTHRAARRSMQERQRHQRAGFAVQLRAWRPRRNAGRQSALAKRRASISWRRRGIAAVESPANQ